MARLARPAVALLVFAVALTANAALSRAVRRCVGFPLRACCITLELVDAVLSSLLASRLPPVFSHDFV